MIKALRNRSISRLWLGQVGSAIGDEIYRVAFIWMAVGLIGSDTGYLASLQVLSALCFGIFGSKWVDRMSAYHTMIRVDLFRALITLTPVVLYYFNSSSFTALVISSVLLTGLGAVFEPSLQSVLPEVAGDASTLKGANGLMSTTLRLARVMGPALIGLLSAIFTTIHFFTLNAFSYLISAWSVYSIRNRLRHIPPITQSKEGLLTALVQSLRVLRKHQAVMTALIAKTTTGGAWSLVYGLGMALLAHEVDPTNVKAFGMLMSSYGAGNIFAAVLVGNLQRKNPERMVYIGLTWLGVCFLAVSFAKSFPLLMLATAMTAIGGPLNDTPFTDLVQRDIPLRDLPRIFRLRAIFENLFTLFFMLISPALFKLMPIRTVIGLCGVFIASVGIYGFILVYSRVTKEPIS